ncbi:unnamed protein product [Ectocarpus sp. CCAP 1310/34]|nr:unnamed protein product [Ectocarpus sp. CCAP 1310/34]
MLRAKSLPEFLEQANTDGMRATMLLQADGALQGAAGKGITALHGQIMGVVSTAMWGEFDGAEMESGTGDLDMILMGMDTGTLGVARLRTGHLVCVYAEDWVQMGSVRTRLLSLRSALEISLRSLEEG